MIARNHEFKSFDEAEETIRTQLINLCDEYTLAIKKILPVLKKSEEKVKEHSDSILIKNVHNECNDHLHNLVQLRIELNENNNDPMVLEVSSEILTNAIDFFKNIPKEIEKTKLFKNDESKTQ